MHACLQGTRCWRDLGRPCATVCCAVRIGARGQVTAAGFLESRGTQRSRLPLRALGCPINSAKPSRSAQKAETGSPYEENGIRRTTANRGGRGFVTRYASSKKVCLSTDLVAGNLAGNFRRLIHKPLTRLSYSPALGSLPGTRFFSYFKI
jgi:hypothetical protein